MNHPAIFGLFLIAFAQSLHAANNCESYPQQIEARLYCIKRTVGSEPLLGYPHTIPSVENLTMEWYKPSESSLDPVPAEEWFPLLGDLFEVEARIRIELIGNLRVDYFSAGLPATWPIGESGLFYATAATAPLAVLDIDFQVNLPHGIGWVDFEASPADPQNPGSETSTTNVLSDRYVGITDFLPRGVYPDGSPVGEFEPSQYWDRQVMIPTGPFTYDGPPGGGQISTAEGTLYVSSWSGLNSSTTTFVFPTPSDSTGTVFAARLTSSTRPYQLASSISPEGEQTLSEAGDITSGELLYWPTVEIIHRYTPKAPAAYARDLAIQNGIPAGDPSDPMWRKNYADRIWDYAIRLRSTTSETSGLNLALRDAEYFWRGVAGGFSYHLPTFTFLDEVFVDPVNTAANSVVGISTPVYNAMKELLLLIGVKSTVPVTEAQILERILDGKAGYTLAGTPGEGIFTAYAPTMRGYNMGLLFLPPEAIQSQLANLVAAGGCFPDLSPGEIFLNMDPVTPSGGPSPMSEPGPASDPQLLPLEAYIDTLQEARISHRYFIREEGMTAPLSFTFNYESGGVTLPGDGDGGGGTMAFAAAATSSPKSPRPMSGEGVIPRGYLGYSCLQDKMVSVMVNGPAHLSTGALRVEYEGRVRFLQPGVPFDLTVFDPEGVHYFTIGGLDGTSLEGGLFNMEIETSGRQAAIIAQTAFYIARERIESGWFADADGDGIDDVWEQDRYGILSLASASSDEDGDGRPLIAEYWLGGDPARFDGGPRVQPYVERGGSSPGEWCFTFERRFFGSDRYIIETSPDLVEWSQAFVDNSEWDADQSGVAPGFFRAIVRIPLAGDQPPRFARVRVWGSDTPYTPGGGGG